MKIIPFTKFWLNCMINLYGSILTSYDSSYEKMMYMNDYKYSKYIRQDMKTSFFSMRFWTGVSVKKYLSYLRREEFYCTDKMKLMNIIKKELGYGKIVCPKINLYYWNPSGATYHNWNFTHYTPLIQYNEKTDCFLALEDNILRGTYGIIEDSGENLLYAMMNGIEERFLKDPDYILFSMKEDIPKCNFTLQDVTDNIDSIIRSLDEEDDSSAFSFYEEDVRPGPLLVQALELFKVAARMRGNQMLVQHIEKCGYLDGIKAKRIVTEFEKIEKQYCIIKNALIRGEEMKLEIFVEKYQNKLYNILKQNLYLERETWLLLKQEIEKFDGKASIL